MGTQFPVTLEMVNTGANLTVPYSAPPFAALTHTRSAHTRAGTHTRARAHTRAHTRTHTHAHKHTHVAHT